MLWATQLSLVFDVIRHLYWFLCLFGNPRKTIQAALHTPKPRPRTSSAEPVRVPREQWELWIAHTQPRRIVGTVVATIQNDGPTVHPSMRSPGLCLLLDVNSLY